MTKIIYALFTVLFVCLIGCQHETAPGLGVASNSAVPEKPAVDSAAPVVADPGAKETPTKIGAENKSGAGIVHGEGANGALHVLAWNVESGMSNPKVIASQLGEHRGLDIIVLTEVLASEFENFRGAIHASGDSKYASINSESGGEDRIEVIYNEARLELLENTEPNEMRGQAVNTGRHRSPIVCLFQDRTSGERFYAVAVHLARGDGEFRKQQAIAIREWARDQADSVIMIGDLNFDYVFETDRGNEAFEELARDNVMTWVRPEEMIDSNWYDEAGDGTDDYPGSLLDGAYVSGPANGWSPTCRILVREGDFPDDLETSDHRAIAIDLFPVAKASQ